MSDDENFLARWSRRKRESAAGDRPTESAPAKSDAVPPEGAPEEAEFDLSALPPIDAIDATTDIRAFFARGVPAALTQAALQKVWTADPAIRDFIGPSENAWDFTAPDGVPGFGPMTPSVRPAAVVQPQAQPDSGFAASSSPAQEVSNHSPAAAPDESMSAESHSFVKKEPHVEASDSSHVEQDDDHIADKQNEDVASQDVNSAADLGTTIARRRHGGALPS